MDSFPYLILAVGIIFLVSIHGFDLKGFVKDHCGLEQSRRHRVELKCSNFEFSKAVIDDIQANDFIITNLTKIHFENCDIGIVNDNFFAKFPKVELLRLDRVNFTTSPPTREFSLASPLKFVQIFITEGSITHTQCSNFLGSMPDLEHIYIGSTLIDFKVMDSNFFENNIKLYRISLYNLSFVSFEEGVFDNLQSLETIYFSKINLSYLPRNLFSKNQILKAVMIEDCNLIRVPELDYPKSLNHLSLKLNRIRSLTISSLKNMENVTILQLGSNQIENFWLEVFDEMKNLTNLDLSNNSITEISKDHFWRIDNMTLIDLRLNNIGKTDLEDYNYANVMLYPTKFQNQEVIKIELEKEDFCGCGHVWAVLVFTIVTTFCAGVFLAWKFSVTPWTEFLSYKMERFD